MTTAWLLLLLLIVYSQSVDSQSTTDDEETCAGCGQTDIGRMLENQQRMFQTIMNRLGEFQFRTTFAFEVSLY